MNKFAKRVSNQQGYCGELQKCSNPEFLLEPRKQRLLEFHGNLTQKSYLLGATTWKVIQRNVWKDVANVQFKPVNNHTKSQHHAWMAINLNKRKMSQLEKCLQSAHKLFSNVCILTFYGLLGGRTRVGCMVSRNLCWTFSINC